MMNHYRTRDYRTARSLCEAFGPYAELQPERKESRKAWAWAIGYGIAIGVIWYLTVAIRAGAD
jgi:hypothetical protein